MIAVIFALPAESRDFRRAIGAVRGDRALWHATIDGRPILVAHCGVGPQAAARAGAALLAAHQPRMLIATGFAGALDPTLALGDLVLATNFSAADLLAEARKIAPGAHAGILASVALPVESPAARKALAAATGASAVDMETAVLVDACAPAGVPVLAVRAISDLAGDALPVPFGVWFDLVRQRPRPFRLGAFLLLHPRRIAPFYSFVSGLAWPRSALAGFIRDAVSGRIGEAGSLR